MAQKSIAINYIKLFWVLVVLTLLNIALVYIPVTGVAQCVLSMGFAIIKALCVAFFFMHLAQEKVWLKWVIALTLLMFMMALTASYCGKLLTFGAYIS